jgi:sulfur relay (sulfurtransferase) DsrC/TusE family protein
MAQTQNTWLQRCVEGVLSSVQIEALARKHGVLVRQRKLDIVLFVRTLVLGFGACPPLIQRRVRSPTQRADAHC